MKLWAALCAALSTRLRRHLGLVQGLLLHGKQLRDEVCVAVAVALLPLPPQ